MKVKFYAVSTLPPVLEANSFYFVQNDNFAEGYLTNNSGVAKSIGNSAMINALVSQALLDFEETANRMTIVADIAARDAEVLGKTKNLLILVLDASADTTVNSGSALYAFDAATKLCHKVSEYESMDVVVSWADIKNRPTSTVTQIDDTVSKAHTHTNKAVLDSIGDVGGNLTYKGESVTSLWNSKDW